MKSTSLRRNSEFYPSPLVLHSESHDWIAAHRLWWLSDSLIPKQTRLTTPFNSIITQQNINRYNLIRAESVIYQRRSPLQGLFSATNWAGLVGTKLTNQNAHRQRRMVTFLVNKPMTSKNANNRSTAMFFETKQKRKIQNDALLTRKCTYTQHLSPGQTDPQVVASAHKLNLSGRDLRCVAKRTRRFLRKYM